MIDYILFCNRWDQATRQKYCNNVGIHISIAQCRHHAAAGLARAIAPRPLFAIIGYRYNDRILIIAVHIDWEPSFVQFLMFHLVKSVFIVIDIFSVLHCL